MVRPSLDLIATLTLVLSSTISYTNAFGCSSSSSSTCSYRSNDVDTEAVRSSRLNSMEEPLEESSSSSFLASLSTRRGWLQNVMKSAVVSGSIWTNGIGGQNYAHAEVFYDPDRYGDKELKIAAVNKLRQNVRDAIVKDPSMASQFLKIAIQDALSYNAATEEGGPDGKIIQSILSGEPSLEKLKPGATKIAEIAKKIKRTTEVTMADVVEFAGAEAIETAGGPRIPIQLGKLDSTSKGVSAYPDLCGSSAAAQNVVTAFDKAGLSEREIALIYGALGSMEAAAASYKQEEEDFEENEMGDVAVYIPSSFGSPKEMYGELIGTMDNSVFKSVAKDLKQKKKADVGVFNDEKVAGWAMKYAGNNNGFLKDLPEAYTKCMSLGRRYTGGKVGSLLGGDDPTY